MLDILQKHALHYNDVIDHIQRAIEYNKIFADNSQNENIESHRITGLIFDEKYSDIVKICDDELDLFNKFGFTVMTTKMDDQDTMKYILGY